MKENNDFENKLREQDILINELSGELQQMKLNFKEVELHFKEVKEELETVKDKLQKLLHERYCKKSEKVATETLPVLDEAKVTPEEATVIEEVEKEISVAAHTRKQPKRKPIPTEFERETVVHDLELEEQICACGCQLHCIGEDKYEQLDYVPAKIKVILHIQKKYACRACETGVTKVAAPKMLLPKSLAAPGLLAHVILSKYEDHLPLYRQEKIWQRIGIDIARSTLCNWVLLAAEGLQVLVDLLKDELLELNYTRADETPVQVMEENKIRTSKRAYMWVFSSGRKDKAIVIYKFAMTRSGSIAENFFAGFAGFLQTDGFSGYNNLGATKNIQHVGCMAHARRKFVEIVKMTKTTGAAHYAVAIIAKLYHIEEKIKQQKLDVTESRDYRQKYAKPILLEFQKWLLQKQKQVPPKGPLGKAIYYFIDHWNELSLYLENGFLDIDNNFIEQRIKPFAVGRKNWLFMGNERGGQAAANFFSLIESAKANGLNTYAYFRYIITELPLIKKLNDKKLLANMLPHNLDQSVLQKYLN